MLKMFLMITIITSLCCVSGCILLQSGSTPIYKIPQSENYALASNGATVEASSSTHGHPPELAINGITDSSNWHKGEGWESVLSLRSSSVWDSYWTRRYWQASEGLKPQFKWLEENFSTWLKITLPARKKINRVVVHAYYSQPRVRYGLGDALIQVWDTTRAAWLNVARVKDGFISYPTSSKPKHGRYDFTFLSIETDQIRILITRGDPKSMKKHQHLETHWARIVEVEVTGEALGGSK